MQQHLCSWDSYGRMWHSPFRQLLAPFSPPVKRCTAACIIGCSDASKTSGWWYATHLDDVGRVLEARH